MRHRISKYQLNRFTSWRRATLISMAKNLLLQQRIKTTKTKARASQPLIERLISLAKLNTLTAKRHAYQILTDHRLVSLLFNDIGKRFSNRNCGFTKILKIGRRRGDNAELVILELTEVQKKEPRKPEKKKELKPEEKIKPQIKEERKPKTEPKVLEKPPLIKKPFKKFLGGIRNIFKKERDSL